MTFRVLFYKVGTHSVSGSILLDSTGVTTQRNHTLYSSCPSSVFYEFQMTLVDVMCFLLNCPTALNRLTLRTGNNWRDKEL